MRRASQGLVFVRGGPDGVEAPEGAHRGDLALLVEYHGADDVARAAKRSSTARAGSPPTGLGRTSKSSKGANRS
jgi:hypothetical protein